MTNLQAGIAAFLLVLSCAGCGPAIEAIPAAQAEEPMAAYRTEFAQMHDAVPMGADSHIEDYQ
jgi:hypothetical protein